MFKTIGKSLLGTFQRPCARGMVFVPFKNKNPSVQFYVRGIPSDMEPHRVKDIFSRKIPVHFVSVPKDGNGKNMGYCFITIFQDQIDWLVKVVSKIEINGQKLTIAPTNGRVTIPIGKRNPG